MKCPLCSTRLDDRASSTAKDRIAAIFVVAILVALSLTALALWKPIDMSHDVLFPLNNDLVAKAFRDSNQSEGGTLAVYGNITNSAEWDLRPLVHIEVKIGTGYESFHAYADLAEPGQTVAFGWAGHIPDLFAAEHEISIRVWGS